MQKLCLCAKLFPACTQEFIPGYCTYTDKYSHAQILYQCIPVHLQCIHCYRHMSNLHQFSYKRHLDDTCQCLLHTCQYLVYNNKGHIACMCSRIYKEHVLHTGHLASFPGSPLSENWYAIFDPISLAYKGSKITHHVHSGAQREPGNEATNHQVCGGVPHVNIPKISWYFITKVFLPITFIHACRCFC